MFYFVFLLFSAIALLFFYPLKFRIFFKENVFSFRCRILFFWLDFTKRKFDLFSKNKKSKRPEIKKITGKILRGEKNSIKDYRKFVIIMLSGIKQFFQKMFYFSLKIKVSANDSSKVALRYSVVCSVVYSLASYVFEDKIKKKNILIIPDFSCCEKEEFEFDSYCYISFFSILKVIFGVFLKFFKEGVFYGQRTA